MPLYEGELLETRLGRRPSMTLEEVVRIGILLARAAGALHRVGVIHRDIKPDNVMLRPDGLTLLDLGAVRLPGLEEEEAGEVPGTPAYVAPEMFSGERGNAATDLYAIGTTLFRAATGAFPYGNADAVSGAQTDRPGPLSAYRPDLPAWFGAALARAVAREPAARFADPGEFASVLESGPAAEAAPRRAATLYERAPVRVWQAIAVLLALTVLASFLLRP
jgi:serine/threonine protein kinase